MSNSENLEKSVSQIRIEKDGALRIYVPKELSVKTDFRNKQKIKITYNKVEKKLIIEELKL